MSDGQLAAGGIVLELGFTGQHYSDDAEEQRIYAEHQKGMTVVRQEYRARLADLAVWYGRKKDDVFDHLAQELEAINRWGGR